MKSSTNLLSWEFRFRMIRRKRLRQWSAVGGVSLVLMIAVCVVQYYRLTDLRNDVRAGQEMCKPLWAMQASTASMRERLRELRGRQSLMAELDDEQIPFRLVGLISHGVRKCEGRLRVEKLTLSEAARPDEKQAPGDRPASQDAAHISVKLSGIAIDNLAIARFVVDLRENGVFERVDLKSSLGNAQSGARARSYLIECTF